MAGKTAYDLSQNNSSIQNLIEKYLEETLKDKNNMPNLNSVEDCNYSVKNLIIDSANSVPDSHKSLENNFDIPASSLGSHKISESPRPQHSFSSTTGIHELIWPEPKSIIELGNISPPFIVGKDLYISIIQVS